MNSPTPPIFQSLPHATSIHNLNGTTGTAGTFWLMAVPVLSTRHIKQDDLENLSLIAGCSYMGALESGLSGGALLAIDRDDLVALSDHPEFAALISYVAERGYDYLRLDPDGEVIGDLPQFDW